MRSWFWLGALAVPLVFSCGPSGHQGSGGGTASGGSGGGGASAGGGGTGGGAIGGGSGGSGGGGSIGGGSGGSGGGSGGSGGGSSDGGLAACPAPSNLTRGLSWVRSNPTFVSGLSVSTIRPTPAEVTEYFHDFGATSAHLWATGLPDAIDGWADAGYPAFRYVSWVDNDGTSLVNALLLGGSPPWPGRIGYQVGDEPADLSALQSMQAGAQAVHQADPGALVILNLGPDQAKGALAGQAAAMAEFDVLSDDDYTYKKGAYQSLSGLRSAALAQGKPYWRYLDGYYDPTGTDSTTESDLRWDAWVGAVYGFTGYTWFIYQVDSSTNLASLFFADAGSYSAPQTSKFTWAAALNAQLAQLGRTLSLLKSVDVRYVAGLGALAQPAGTTALTPGAGGDPYLSSVASTTLGDALVGLFTDDCGEHYVLVQNQAHAGADFLIASQSTLTFRVTLDFSHATDPTLDQTQVQVLDPLTGQVVDQALTAAGTSGATIDFALPAGGGVLFKYKTARPFAQQ